MISNIDNEVGYTSESLRMLESKEGQLNAVFACFGSAAQRGQFYEVALDKFLWVYNKICKESLTLQDLEIIKTKKTKFQKQPMGALLKKFKKYVTIDDDRVEQCLDSALVKRNFLIHDFFLEREKKFDTEKGRREMVRELIGIQKELEIATKLTNGMRVAVSEALGLKYGNEDKAEERDTASEALFSIKVHIPE